VGEVDPDTPVGRTVDLARRGFANRVLKLLAKLIGLFRE